jgi:hypothetical protein
MDNGMLWVIRGSRLLRNGMTVLYDKGKLGMGLAMV